VHSVTDPVTGAISYTYDPMGNRTSMTLPGGGSWTYQYSTYTEMNAISKDDPNTVYRLVAQAIDDQGRIVRFRYNTLGMPNGAFYNQAFDQNGNLVAYCHSRSLIRLSTDGTPATNDWPSYYTGEQFFRTDYQPKTVQTTWNWVNPNTGQWQSRILSQNDYTYDNAGNRLTNTVSNQPLNVDGTAQVNQDGSPVLNSRTENYGYDELNRLTSVD
jgi:YD repeat-containing protein